MQNTELPPSRAVNYRVKAELLRHMAAGEVTETLRVQLTNLALQFEQLACSLEKPNRPDGRKNSN